MSDTAIVWFRRDLRVRDNESLDAALRELAAGGALVPAYTLPTAGRWSPGTASRAWLSASLSALDGTLRERGSRLIPVDGPAPVALCRLAAETGARRVYCTRDWTPTAIAEERAVERDLAAIGVTLRVHEGQLALPPGALLTGEGRPYRVFTPFYRAWSRAIAGLDLPANRPSPTAVLPAPPEWPRGARLPATPADAPALNRWWTPGESGALARARSFMADDLDGYTETHDRADLAGVSRLSPHLACGEIAVTRVISSALSAGGEDAVAFVRQIAWREFGYHLLHTFPQMPERPLRERFEAVRWRDDPAQLDAWKQGLTGFPLVDAGMRELAQTGWMHNRARMVAGSFLAKSLLLAWQDGQRHFWERLADADLALNAFNWQWAAGTGADPAPYFRMLNPTLQGAKVDPEGAYVRAWVPELAGLPARWIHQPWKAPATLLAAAGIVLGGTYPERLVDHAAARERARVAYREQGP